MSLVLYLLGLVSLYFVVVLALRCARGFGQPMADPSPSPEAVGAGPGLVTNNDEPQMALESDSRDCVGSNNPSHDSNIEGSCVALYPCNGAHQEFKAAMSAASTSILRVAAIAGKVHVRGISIEHFER